MKLPIRSIILRFAAYGALFYFLVTCIYIGVDISEKLLRYDGGYADLALGLCINMPTMLVVSYFNAEEIFDKAPYLVFIVLNVFTGALFGMAIGLCTKAVNQIRCLLH
jgi:hypothetical protein